ncbi:hypothetical protein [Thalassotalea agariperforans]
MIQSFLSFVVRAFLKLAIFLVILFSIFILGGMITEALSIDITQFLNLPEQTRKYTIIAPLLFLSYFLSKWLVSVLNLDVKVNKLFKITTGVN